MQDEPIDPYANDFHVYIDGGLRHRIPCVCAYVGQKENAAMRRDIIEAWGVDLAEHMRETVRAHLEAYVRSAHPSSSVSVR